MGCGSYSPTEANRRMPGTCLARKRTQKRGREHRDVKKGGRPPKGPPPGCVSANYFGQLALIYTTE